MSKRCLAVRRALRLDLPECSAVVHVKWKSESSHLRASDTVCCTETGTRQAMAQRSVHRWMALGHRLLHGYELIGSQA
jgi:hypothetical protein